MEEPAIDLKGRVSERPGQGHQLYKRAWEERGGWEVWEEAPGVSLLRGRPYGEGPCSNH